ncbi:hypothetical protein OOK60_06180 [Trichothermofontia sichuanensis B231]|uniref:hypothetical protein n=1 Tax=Trichothermofontia sichuanensis TaxID=3045816 RepID=UPI002246D2D6|nr:hypothetical protein [Trichothermofontia sichuanensis]UZQ55657.1 hypothetical protein OOK60_06180 [Trichothermofontia sichuanensis B231]
MTVAKVVPVAAANPDSRMAVNPRAAIADTQYQTIPPGGGLTMRHWLQWNLKWWAGFACTGFPTLCFGRLAQIHPTG